MKRLLFLGLLASTGCGLQLGTGPSRNATGHTQQTYSLGASLAVDRRSNGIVGTRVVTIADQGLELKALIVHGGWDFVAKPGWITLEPGVDLGMGSPVTNTFRGIGAYAGAAGNLRLRPFWNVAREPSFVIASLVPEIVFAPRAGWWMPSERSAAHGATDFEFGWEIALRINLSSDFSSGPQGHPSTDRQVPEGVR